MATATVTRKEQITIPAEVRRALQVTTGDRVQFVQIEPGQFVFLAASQSVTALKDMFDKPTKIVLIADRHRATVGCGSAAR